MNTSTSTATKSNVTARPARLYYLDWLRVLAMLSIFFYHNNRFFDFDSWHVDNTVTSLGPTIFMAHSTTAYYEVLARDCPCFQYRDEDFREGPSLGYFFTEPEELIKLIKQFINNPESFHTKMRELTDYVFGQYTDRPSEIYSNKVLSVVRRQ
jgi:hypothetical protein